MHHKLHHESRPALLCLLLTSGCGLDLFETRDESARHSAVPDAGPPDPLAPGTPLRVLSYNVAGLPQRLSGGSPERNIPLISPRLNDYDLVLVQEDFAYHAQLVRDALHAFQSAPDRAGQNLGDGLNLLSVIPFESHVRDGWNHCHGTFDSGSDCLTQKGFSRARLVIGPRAALDVYNVHMDAGHGADDVRARRGNFKELARAIAEHSHDVAVLVVGDFNERYRDAEEHMEELLAASGLSDSWLEFVHGGVLPSLDTLRADCVPDPDALECERIDKLLYRASAALSLELVDYALESDAFEDTNGAPLSDHKPVSATFELTPSQ